MSSFQIIVGSMLGGTEYVAEACQETLESLNHQTKLHLLPDFPQIPCKDQTWLICTSTHGAGDYPDNILSFVDNLTKTENDLSSLKFLVIGVGDTNYDTFCLAAKKIKKCLLLKGCSEIVDIKLLDMQQEIDPELEGQTWLLANKDHL